MINKLQIRNFKCFQQATDFEFSQLNLLTGINGRGKSSLLQALLILSQSNSRSERGKINELIINGELVDFGNFDDIKNSETPREENIHFRFNIAPSIDVVLQYAENKDDAFSAQCVKFETTPHGKETEFIQSIKSIHFVSADRLGPLKYVDKMSLPKFTHVGTRGEYTVNILANSMNLPTVNEALCKGANATSVLQQTIEWLAYILDGAKIDIKGLDKESSVIYMLLNNKKSSYSYKPINVGFGYSYILPLIVTGLIAQKGETVIIENPEAHLHPKAQSRVTEFFAKVAACGVQVFIESHSEHILNGLRVCALNSEIGITTKDISIHYFNELFQSEKLEMDEKAKIQNWPLGFFDQQENDLAEIFRYSR
jgi:predicted ATPase